jgi:hypothetical protein
MLKRTLGHYHLDGIALDIEEHITLFDAQKLVAQRNRDFSRQFIMTMSPVAPDLWGYVGFSGFNYKEL